MDRFDAMRAFVQVVESGSYTKAALQLNLHKATVSQQIQQLEDKLGTRLLTRTTRSVTPTEEGLAYRAQPASVGSVLRRGIQGGSYSVEARDAEGSSEVEWRTGTCRRHLCDHRALAWTLRRRDDARSPAPWIGASWRVVASAKEHRGHAGHN